MKIIETPQEMQKITSKLRVSGTSIGFVPTMGALHKGHLTLIQKCKKENETAVVSIFVNPIQFGPAEDYHKYPRTLTEDQKLLESIPVDYIFAPPADAMFPPHFQTKINVEQLSIPLCGKFRPGHFQGVATVVLKLFQITTPHQAYFGEKDYQQLQIIKQMVQDLNLPVKIIPCPIIRESDGLAVSSRNQYLSSQEREEAPLLYRSLLEGRKLIEQGEKNPKIVQERILNKLKQGKFLSVEYVEIVHPETLQSVSVIEGKVLVALAVWAGKTRLIDNLTTHQL
jgi:pantoate--beta-alanine ligase